MRDLELRGADGRWQQVNDLVRSGDVYRLRTPWPLEAWDVLCVASYGRR